MSTFTAELKQKVLTEWSKITGLSESESIELSEMFDNVIAPEIELIEGIATSQYEAKLLRTLREIRKRGEGKTIDEIAKLIAAEMQVTEQQETD
jgi:hypothetical protein